MLTHRIYVALAQWQQDHEQEMLVGFKLHLLIVLLEVATLLILVAMTTALTVTLIG